jgi:hypothetical protein
VERLTNDGYFSVDVYLPDDDVVLEFDGPTHFTLATPARGLHRATRLAPRQGRCARSCATCF